MYTLIDDNEAYFYRITDLASLVRSYSLYDIIYEKSNGKQQKTHRRNSSSRSIIERGKINTIALLYVQVQALQ
jgi:hypothetical protein